MLKKLVKRRRLLLIFPLLAIYIFSFLPLLVPSTFAQEPDAPDFVDRLYISYNGEIWGNPNPYNKGDIQSVIGDVRGLGENGFDYIKGWRWGDSLDLPDCFDYMRVTDLNGTPKANIQSRKSNEFGDGCVDDGGTRTGVAFDRTGNKFVNAYRRDADNIFAPAGVTDNIGGCGLDASYTSFDLLLDTSTNFRRPTEQDRDNRYYKIRSSADLNREVWLDTGGGPSADIVVQVAECGRRVRRTFEDVVLVNNGAEVTGEAGNCIPRIYGAPSKSCPEGDDSDPTNDTAGNGEEASATCESENTQVLDWILCGTINAIDKVLVGKDGTGGLFGEVDDLLNISSQKYDNPKLKESWSYFRNIASLALVVIGLVMVVGQALSKE